MMSITSALPPRKKVKIEYCNHNGQRKNYVIFPIVFYYGSTSFYPVSCYLLKAYVLEKSDYRTFSLAKIIKWEEMHDE